VLPFALGVDLGGTKTEARLLAADGAELWRQRVATPGGDYRATLQMLQALVQQARGLPVVQAAGGFSIGIGTPGTQRADGRMKNCNSTCLNGQPLQADLQTLLGQPLALANDANCLALSEATDGAGAGAGVVFAVILGTGTGAGVVVNGQVLTGPNGLAGEWGHNPLPWGAESDFGPDPQLPCYCGRRGCVESLLSGPALAADHQRCTGQALDGPAIVAAAAAGDAHAQATLARHSDRLARALAAVVNLLDPDVVVLGGGLSQLPHLYTEVPARWGRWVFAAGSQGHLDGGQAEAVHTRLLPALHGDASGVRGAAWLGRQQAAASLR
jgi:fructokinase